MSMVTIAEYDSKFLANLTITRMLSQSDLVPYPECRRFAMPVSPGRRFL